MTQLDRIAKATQAAEGRPDGPWRGIRYSSDGRQWRDAGHPIFTRAAPPADWETAHDGPLARPVPWYASHDYVWAPAPGSNSFYFY